MEMNEMATPLISIKPDVEGRLHYCVILYTRDLNYVDFMTIFHCDISVLMHFVHYGPGPHRGKYSEGYQKPFAPNNPGMISQNIMQKVISTSKTLYEAPSKSFVNEFLFQVLMINIF